MNNTSDLADLIFTGETSDIPAPQIYRLALRWTLSVFDKMLKKIGRSCAGSTVKGSFLDLKILQDILQDMLGSFKFFLKTLITV